MSYELKYAPRDAHSREGENCRKRPRSARECAKAHSFLKELHYRHSIRIRRQSRPEVLDEEPDA